MNVSRRSALRIIGSSGTAMALGLVPELGLRSGRGDDGEDGYEAVTKNLRVRRLSGGELTSEIDSARGSAGAGALWNDLTSRGYRPDLQLAYGSRARLSSDRGLVGHFVAVPFADASERRAKLYYGIDMLGKPVAFAAEWLATRPDVLDVWETRGGRASRRSTVHVSGESALVEFTDGRRVTGKLPVIHQGKPGLAAVAASPCSLNGLACALACITVVEWSCIYEFSVACVGVTALCPPCGAFCELVTIVICTVATTVSCYYVCDPCDG